jgi:hypothetical protein
MSLPIRKVTLYKHGLGFFERGGKAEGDGLTLEFPRSAMDDILKSLVVISENGQVLGLEFETPPDRNPAAHRQALSLEANHSLTQLLGALRGQRVRIETAGQTHEGQLVGSELEEGDHLKRAKVSLYVPEQKQVVVLGLESLETLTLLEAPGQGDLEFFLKTVASDEERATARLRLSQGQHELSVSYIAPARLPPVRPNYRATWLRWGRVGKRANCGPGWLRSWGGSKIRLRRWNKKRPGWSSSKNASRPK